MNTESILKKHDLRVTQFRIDVLNLFYGSKKALSANEIEQQMLESDRITLYRTLKSFEEKGVIHKAIDGTNIQKFALCESECTEHHHQDEHVHFHCIACSNTFCLEGVSVPTLTLPDGYVVNQANLIVNGICKQCKNK